MASENTKDISREQVAAALIAQGEDPTAERIEIAVRQQSDQARNIETQEYAKKVLARFAGNERVSDLYDDDEQFANAIRDLAGPDFEYPDFSHLTVSQASKKAEAMAARSLDSSLAGSRKEVGFALAGRRFKSEDWSMIGFHPTETVAADAMKSSADKRNLAVMPAEVYFAANGNVRQWNRLGEPIAERKAPEVRQEQSSPSPDM